MDQPNDPSDQQPTGQSRPPVAGAPSAPPPPPPGYAPPPYAPPKGGGMLYRLAVTVVGSVLIFSILLNVYFVVILAAQMKSGISEAAYEDGSSDHKVVIVEVSGTIDGGMSDYMRQVFKYLEENTPQAVVLRIDSGGGGVTASDQIWHYFDKFKKAHNIPVVASFGQIAASGGYYIAMPADHILCEQTGVTGSIGVMAQAPTMQDLMQEKLGIKWETMVASGSPDKAVGNDIYRDWTDADRAVFENLLNSAYNRFLEVVVEGRKDVLNEDEVRALAQGDIYTAEEAKANKLIDDIGYLDQAVTKAADMAGTPANTAPLVTIVRRPQPFSLLSLVGAEHGATIHADPEQVRSWLTEFTRMRLEYRHPW